NDDAIVATGDLADWRNVASDNGHSNRERFQGSTRKAFPQRWQEENIAGAKQGRDVSALSQEAEGVRESGATHRGLHVFAKRTVTNEHELRIGPFPEDLSRDPNKTLLILRNVESTYVNQYRAAAPRSASEPLISRTLSRAEPRDVWAKVDDAATGV